MKFMMSLTGIFFIYVFIYHIAGKQTLGTTLVGVFFFCINCASLLAMAPVAWLTNGWARSRHCC